MSKKHYDRNEVLEFIKAKKAEYGGDSPSYREISDHFGMNSTSVAKYILEEIEKDGKIELGRGKFRSIRVIGGEWVFHE